MAGAGGDRALQDLVQGLGSRRGSGTTGPRARFRVRDFGVSGWDDELCNHLERFVAAPGPWTEVVWCDKMRY